MQCVARPDIDEVREAGRFRIASRKQPKQARSNDLVAAVVEASLRVLATEGAARFTTSRAAEQAGVSVGSLYQYFPNKAAILFRLQADEWRRTTAPLRSILEDATQPPHARLRALAADLLMDTLSAVGKRFSERPRTGAEIAAYADALADMLCAWLETLAAADGAARDQRPRMRAR
nr:TetR family transcriptional regulator [Telluria antibiotica]